jgi:hypothetical protein
VIWDSREVRHRRSISDPAGVPGGTIKSLPVAYQLRLDHPQILAIHLACESQIHAKAGQGLRLALQLIPTVGINVQHEDAAGLVFYSRPREPSREGVDMRGALVL